MISGLALKVSALDLELQSNCLFHALEISVQRLLASGCWCRDSKKEAGRANHRRFMAGESANSSHHDAKFH